MSKSAPLSRYEIFHDLGEGEEPLSLESVQEIELAKALMEEVAARVPGCYIVWDAIEGEVIARIDSTRL